MADFMSPDVMIDVSHVSKEYRLGSIGHNYLFRDLQSWWARATGRADPNSKLEHAPGTEGIELGSKFKAVNDVSFQVKRGEVIGLIGRNGAGKSTLLKVLSRITAPSEGRVRLRGRLASLLEVGTGFHPELTGRENVFLNGTILGMSRAEIASKFDAIVEFSGVAKFIDTPVKRYSSGMYVRLAFSVAAHLDPDILLVDEVLAVGDAEFQKRCLGNLGQSARDGRTVLLVSHNMSSIMNLCDRVILMEKGSVLIDDVPQVAVDYYLNSGKIGNRQGEVVWDDQETAPGNENVRLHSVRILQPGAMGPTADVDISKETLVEISYWNRTPGMELYSAIWLRDGMDTFVLSSTNHHGVSLNPDPWNLKPAPPGLYRSVCRIPANFLNEGTYHVTAIVGRGYSENQVLEDYAVSFQVHDTGEMRAQYSGYWLGCVRPKLDWATGPSGA